MGDIASFCLLSIAVFCGAFVSGLAGFAFSAVAGAILLHVLPPLEAVPLMMACSITVQATNLWALRKNIRWKQSSALVFGGLLGVPIAVWLLQTADARIFRESFGLAIACYAGYTLFRPVLSRRLQMNVRRNALIGFGGGLFGGLTAMPGAIPTIWCDIHGVPKTEQRGLVQPFIAAMQVFALVLMLLQNDLSSKVLVEFVASIPALLAGAALGIFAFRCVNEGSFRRIILTMLLFSGVLLAL
ncbi:sulfite exporter TauE/SafE family protein [Bradyrhizobium sp. STM 3557]|uniref:sulfite exporter TauE/SafE family protein n=1 Tax=Bradyrhizobium sp. STM 3557 TaxID=578920 RepID=UPI00388E434A